MFSVRIMSVYSFVLVLCWTLIDATGGNLPPPCPSEIYCHGPLLNTIQMARIFNDSKTFVDMKLKYSPNVTLEKFYDFMKEHGEVPGSMDVLLFVNKTFESAGSEFENWIPEDWKEDPKFLNEINDPNFHNWGSKLNDLWKLLGRKMKDEVHKNEEMYSIIWVPHPVIVPGGRFREFYYWDSYWIVKGLLLSEMTQTVKGMLVNFLYIVDQYGFVPNGGRIYYSKRSQPPLLIPMIKMYYDETKDLDFIKKNIGTMEKEFNFWMTNHTVSINIGKKNYTLAVYGDKSSGARPESYYEDVRSAGMFTSNDKKEQHYSELKAAAESGWDFSSRWFISNGTNKGNLTSLNTRSIIPVDLNSFVYENAVFLSEFHTMLNNTIEAQHYKEIAAHWLEAVDKVLWHDDVGAWLDYDIMNNVRRNYFYPTNIAPLFTGCYDSDPQRRNMIIRKVRKYLQEHNVMQYKGGVPTTDEQTGEQWDFPNAWPPLQHMMVMGLDRTGDRYAQKIAYDLALTWVRSNFLAFNETGHMFEKYNAEEAGGNGGGGEYEVQLGFGWSNGVIMDLLHKYGKRMRLEDPKLTSEIEYQVADAGGFAPVHSGHTSANPFGQVLTGLLGLLVLVAFGFVGIAFFHIRRNHTSIPNVKTRVMHRNQYTELRNIPNRGKNSR